MSCCDNVRLKAAIASTQGDIHTAVQTVVARVGNTPGAAKGNSVVSGEAFVEPVMPIDGCQWLP